MRTRVSDTFPKNTKEKPLNLLSSDFKEMLEKYMAVLGEHYGGVMTPSTMVIYMKPCPKDLIIYNGEFYITSSQPNRNP